MNSSYSLALLLAAGTLLVTTPRLHAADTDARIESAAKNAAEQGLVTKLINDINGVDRVINNMTIAVPIASK